MYRIERHSFYLWVLEKATKSSSWAFDSWKHQESEEKSILGSRTHHQTCQHVKAPSVLRKWCLVWEGKKQDGIKMIFFAGQILLSMSIPVPISFYH